MANAAAADYTMPQDLTEQIIQQLWRVDVLAPRAAAVNQGCSLAAKRAAATLDQLQQGAEIGCKSAWLVVPGLENTLYGPPWAM